MPKVTELHEKAKIVYDRYFRTKFITLDSYRTEGKTKSTGARISEEKYVELTDIAKRAGCSVNQFIASAVYYAMEEFKAHEEAENAKEKDWLQDFDSKSETEQHQFLSDILMEKL